MSKFVKLNPKASIFYDPVTQVKVIKGKVVELTDAIYQRRSIQSAIESGYLKSVEKPSKAEEVEQVDQGGDDTPDTHENKEKDLRGKLMVLYNEGKTAKETKDKFTMDELKSLAAEFEIEAEEGDTKLDLVEAIFEELNNSDQE